VWDRTVLFVTYDENGGFFDHVAPPTAPPGTPGEYVTTSPLPAATHGVAGPIGLGFRVPLLVISPFSRGGRINSDVADHTSLLRFLETRFGVEVPNLSAWRRAQTSDLTSTLDLTRARPGVPSLPYQALSDKLIGKECAVRSAAPPPHQRVPTQHA
jgi:phospholipase C